MESITLVAPDISCNHCVDTVQRAVAALEGVDSVRADAETKEVHITFDTSRTTTQSIVETLEAAGYPARS